MVTISAILQSQEKDCIVSRNDDSNHGLELKTEQALYIHWWSRLITSVHSQFFQIKKIAIYIYIYIYQKNLCF